MDVSKRLYTEAQQKQIRIKNIEENKNDPEWDKNQNECTFSPRYMAKMYYKR
jgi:hypothetical protein